MRIEGGVALHEKEAEALEEVTDDLLVLPPCVVGQLPGHLGDVGQAALSIAILVRGTGLRHFPLLEGMVNCKA